jgi:hypothetical protein
VHRLWKVTEYAGHMIATGRQSVPHRAQRVRHDGTMSTGMSLAILRPTRLLFLKDVTIGRKIGNFTGQILALVVCDDWVYKELKNI